MIINDTYKCYIVDEDEDGEFFPSQAVISLSNILYIKSIDLSAMYPQCTEIVYNTDNFVYIDEDIRDFMIHWINFKRAVNLYSIN
jgi:hypothetical protein